MKQEVKEMVNEYGRTQREQELYDRQSQLWEDFEKQFGTNCRYNWLETREYLDNKRKYNITPESSVSLKRKADHLPVRLIEVGKETWGDRSYGFYAHFAFGFALNSEIIDRSYRGGFATPQEAYNYILDEATKYNRSFQKNEKEN